MDQQTIAVFIGGLIVTHFATIIGAIVWGVKHIVKYILLQEKVAKLEQRLEKNENDLNSAFNKIREKSK